MTKKHFIAMADMIRKHNKAVQNAVNCGVTGSEVERFTSLQIQALANFCATLNPRFDRDTFIDYSEGKCGPSGGKLRGKLRRSA